jgi:AraC-like DNA-binding protein
MPTIFSERLFARFKDQLSPYLDRVGIPPTVMTRHDVEIADMKYVELLETVARESNPNIGLEMALAVEPQDLGVLGHAVAASRTIGEAIEIFSRYLYVFSQSNAVRLDIAEQQAVCSYTVSVLQPDLVRQDAEFSIGFIVRKLLDLGGRRVRPSLVEFRHSRLPGRREHEKVFGCDVVFERAANRVHFQRDVLDYPVLSADLGLLEALRFYLEDRLVTRSEEEDFVAKIQHLVTTSLAHGLPTVEQMAKRMGISGRSMQRRLAERNMVFSDLIESICEPIALDYVRNTRYSFTDIALMVGYSDLSAFSRAFKRWTGHTPSEMREEAAASDKAC